METIKKITDFCRDKNLTIDQFYGKETVGGSLDLRRLTSIPEGFNPTVGDSLDLSSLTSIPEGFNPTVGGYLDLRSLTSIPEGFNPTVGGYLDLSSLTSITEGFNPTVGGSLDLSSLTSIPEGFNPTVGGSLNLRSRLKAKYKKLPVGYLLSWQGGKYLLADGVFTEVISHKGNVYHVRKIGNKKIIYLITDGNGKWSHGATLKEAKSDLMFKISDRTKDDYKHLKLTDLLTFSDAIMCYRVITGACSFGVKDFISNRLKKNQKKYTISEITEITKGEWGNRTFSDFFKIK
jgi:hypothetical protein